MPPLAVLAESAPPRMRRTHFLCARCRSSTHFNCLEGVFPRERLGERNRFLCHACVVSESCKLGSSEIRQCAPLPYSDGLRTKRVGLLTGSDHLVVIQLTPSGTPTRSDASWLIPSLTQNPTPRHGHVCKVCKIAGGQNRCSCCGHHYHAENCSLDNCTLQLGIGQSLVCTTCLNLGLNNATMRSDDAGLATDKRVWVPSLNTQSTWMLLTQQQDEPSVLSYFFRAGVHRQVNALIPFMEPGLAGVNREHHRYCQVCTKQTRSDSERRQQLCP